MKNRGIAMSMYSCRGSDTAAAFLDEREEFVVLFMNYRKLL